MGSAAGRFRCLPIGRTTRLCHPWVDSLSGPNAKREKTRTWFVLCLLNSPVNWPAFAPACGLTHRCTSRSLVPFPSGSLRPLFFTRFFVFLAFRSQLFFSLFLLTAFKRKLKAFRGGSLRLGAAAQVAYCLFNSVYFVCALVFVGSTRTASLCHA